MNNRTAEIIRRPGMGHSAVTLMVAVFACILAVPAGGETIAYWQFDSNSSSPGLSDCVNSYHLTASGTFSSSTNAAINPIPNPDGSPAFSGDSAANPDAGVANASIDSPGSGSTRLTVTSDDQTVFNLAGKNFTFEGWFRSEGAQTNTASSWGHIIGGTRNAGGYRGYVVRMGEDGRIYTYFQDDTTSFGPSTSASYDDGVFHHFALVWQDDAGVNSAGLVELYIDGELKGSGSAPSGWSAETADSGAEDFIIGGRTAGNNWDGQFDEFRFSSLALLSEHFLCSSMPDTNAPAITGLSPTNSATEVFPHADLVLTFNEPVFTNSVGSVVISNINDHTMSVIAVGDISQVAVIGSQLAIDPVDDFETNTTYVVFIDTNAIMDAATNFYAGITNASTWSFETGVPGPLDVVPAMNKIAVAAVRPEGSPEYADVCLRYGWVRTSFPTVDDASNAIHGFHATRVDWFYPGSHSADSGAVYVTSAAEDFINWCHTNGIEIVGAMSTLTTTAAWDSGAPLNGGRYRGDPNNTNYVFEAVKWGKALVDAGVDAIIVDDFFGYDVESDRQDFNDNVILAIKAYAPSIKIASNKGHTLGTIYVTPYDFDFHYSDSNFIPDPSDWWDAAKAHRAEGSAFLSHPNVYMTDGQRRVLIGLGYAAGAHLMAPWDEWISDGNPRLFADPADFADLYGFARALGAQGYLNGYEDAAVGGYDLTETRYGASLPVSVLGGSGSLSVFARAKPDETDAPVVLHLVESGTAQPSTLNLPVTALFGTSKLQLNLMTPSLYDQSSHGTAESNNNYSALAQVTSLTSTVSYDTIAVEVPSVTPWGALVIQPASNSHALVLSPVSPIVITNDSQQFTATVVDKLGFPIDPQPTVTWTSNTGGTINAAGDFTAGGTPAVSTVAARSVLPDGETVIGSQTVFVQRDALGRAARWQLNSDALDSIGTHHGLLQGGALFSTNRKEGTHALLLDGADDYVDISDHPDLDIGTGDFSYVLWFKRDANATSNLRLISKGGQDNSDTGFCVYGSDTSISVVLCNGTARETVSASHSGVGEWIHLSVTIDRSGNLNVYVDGVRIASRDISSWIGQDLSSSRDFRLGRSSTSFLGWDGALDDVSLFHRVLTASEVRELSGRPPPTGTVIVVR